MNDQTIKNKYEIISRIGEGGYGIVYKAREMGTNYIVTLKQIKKEISESNETITQNVHNEIELLQNLKGNSNIIGLKDYQFNPKKEQIFIIYDYHEFDIYSLIYRREAFSVRQVKSYFRQMINSLLSVHSQGFIHGDVKPENFLISNKNEIKLIDFGLSMRIDQKNKNTKIGTVSYNAPELILGDSQFGIESDVWSLGCTFYEMLTKEKLIKHCYSDSEIAKQMVEIFGLPDQDDYPQFYTFPNKSLFLKSSKFSKLSTDEIFEQKLPEEFKPFKELLIGMLQINPKDRISLIDALNHQPLDDAEVPESLPHITLQEKTFNASSYKSKNRSKNTIADYLYKQLRPDRIVPQNFI